MKGTVHEAISILEKLEATTKRTTKENLLENYHKNPFLAALFFVAYDPRVTYGVIPYEDPNKYKPSKPYLSPTKAVRELEALAKRLALRKLTGKDADKAVESYLCRLPKRFRVWAIRALRKNLRIGVAQATFGQYWKGLVSEFGAPAYHKWDLVTRKPELTFPCHAEPKIDGLNFSLVFPGKKYPITFLVEGQEEYCLSRGQIHYPILNKLWHKIRKHAGEDTFVVAEAYAKWSKEERTKYKGPWSKATSLVKTGMTPTGFKPELVDKEHQQLFDKDFQLLIFEYGSNSFYSNKNDYTDTTSRRKRRKKLVDLVKAINDPQILAMPCVTLHSMKELDAYYKECLNAGFEGIMIKPLDAPLRNKRTYDCMKLKPEEDLDGVIVGIYQGTGKNSKWGGYMKVFLPKYKTITRCNLRTDKDRYDFWKRRDELVGVQAEFKKQQEPKGAEISASRFVVFKRLREDLKRTPAPKCAILLSKYEK